MNKRIIATPLWFLTGWMVGAMAAFVVGLPSWFAPVTALCVAAVIAIDPAGWFWVRRNDKAADATSTRAPAVSSQAAARASKD